MRVPNGFEPSEFSKMILADTESALAEKRERTSSGGDRAVGRNEQYMAEAEGQVAPFLLKSIERDAQRRNYYIVPGGARIWTDKDELEFEDGKVEFEDYSYDAPDEHEALGHDKVPSVGPRQ